MRALIRLLTHFVTAVLALAWAMPLWFVLINALKAPTEFSHSYFWQIPSQINLWQNVEEAWSTAGLGQGFLNSLIYGTLGSALAILIAALAAYGIAVLKIKGRFYWFLLIYSGTVFPFQMYLIPLFSAYAKVGLYDTFLGLLLFYTAIAIPFSLFVLRNHFLTIPVEIAEAAKIDGSRDFTIFWRMYLPLSGPPIVMLFLFQFTWIWNDLLFGLTLSNSNSVRPVMAALAGLEGAFAGTSLPVVLTAALITSLPTLLLFGLLQRYFIKGLAVLGDVS